MKKLLLNTLISALFIGGAYAQEGNANGKIKIMKPVTINEKSDIDSYGSRDDNYENRHYRKRRVDPRSKINYNHLIGLTASAISGAGLSYRYAFSSFFLWRVTGIYFADKNDSSTTEFYDFGTEVQFSLFELRPNQRVQYRAYTAIGASYWSGVETYVRDETNAESLNSIYDVRERRAHVGVNFGLEMKIAFRIVGHIEMGYAFYRHTNNDNYSTEISGAIGTGFLF